MPDLLPLIRTALDHPFRYPVLPDALTAEMDFTDLGIGMVDKVTIQMAIEEELGVEIACAVAQGWECFGDVLGTVGGSQLA